MTSNAASLRAARVVAPATLAECRGAREGLFSAMGNLLCPPYRPTRFPYDERRRGEYERRARSAERAFPGGERGVGEDGRPTLLPEEVNRLPIEEYHSPEEMSRWDVKRLKFHLKQARANSPRIGPTSARCHWRRRSPSPPSERREAARRARAAASAWTRTRKETRTGSSRADTGST